MSEHSVIVEFYNFAEKFWRDEERTLDPLFALQNELHAVLESNPVGELDGHEIAIDGSDGTLYFYGPDADILFAVIRPVLEASVITQDGAARLRYGAPDEPNVRRTRIKIAQKPH